MRWRGIWEAPSNSEFGIQNSEFCGVCYHRVVLTGDMKQSLTEAVASTGGLRLLVLFGSRARGDERADSDWDFGYLGSPSLHVDGVLERLVIVLRGLCVERDVCLAGGFNEAGHEIADREARRQSGRLDTRGLNHERVLAIAANHEIGERFARRMNFGADAAAAEPEIVERHVAQQPPRRFDERGDRHAVVFVVVLPILERRRRTEPHLAGRRLHDM